MFFMLLTRMLKISYQLDVIYYSIHKLIFFFMPNYKNLNFKHLIHDIVIDP